MYGLKLIYVGKMGTRYLMKAPFSDKVRHALFSKLAAQMIVVNTFPPIKRNFYISVHCELMFFPAVYCLGELWVVNGTWINNCIPLFSAKSSWSPFRDVKWMGQSWLLITTVPISGYVYHHQQPLRYRCGITVTSQTKLDINGLIHSHSHF